MNIQWHEFPKTLAALNFCAALSKNENISFYTCFVWRAGARGVREPSDTKRRAAQRANACFTHCDRNFFDRYARAEYANAGIGVRDAPAVADADAYAHRDASAQSIANARRFSRDVGSVAAND